MSEPTSGTAWGPGPSTLQALAAQHARMRALLGQAWGVIANAGPPENLGDWRRLHPEWQRVAAQWRDDFHALLAELEGGA